MKRKNDFLEVLLERLAKEENLELLEAVSESHDAHYLSPNGVWIDAECPTTGDPDVDDWTDRIIGMTMRLIKARGWEYEFGMRYDGPYAHITYETEFDFVTTEVYQSRDMSEATALLTAYLNSIKDVTIKEKSDGL